MKRFDLRHLHGEFYDRMGELIAQELASGEVGIFLFEIDDFSHVARSAQFVSDMGYEVMNSVRFNHRDWTLVVRKSAPKPTTESSPSTSGVDSAAESSKPDTPSASEGAC